MAPASGGRLSDFEKDALGELGNIGAGNATTALSQMLGDRAIRMTSPTVSLVPAAELADRLGRPDEPVTVVFQRVRGELAGQVAFLLSEQAARRIVSSLLPASWGPSPSSHRPLPERGPADMEASALLELGNIVLTSYLNALGELTSLKLIPSVPAAASDMLAAVIGSMAAELEAEEAVLVIETRLHGDAGTIDGYLLFFPEEGQLSRLLLAMGLSGEDG